MFALEIALSVCHHSIYEMSLGRLALQGESPLTVVMFSV